VSIKSKFGSKFSLLDFGKTNLSMGSDENRPTSNVNCGHIRSDTCFTLAGCVGGGVEKGACCIGTEKFEVEDLI